MLQFMLSIPCFKQFTKNSILKFSYYLKKEKHIRGQVLYQTGEPA